MQVKEKTGIELSEHLAMIPTASVSGLYLANEECKYFGTIRAILSPFIPDTTAVGKITKEQVECYSERTGRSISDIEANIPNALAYDDTSL